MAGFEDLDEVKRRNLALAAHKLLGHKEVAPQVKRLLMQVDPTMQFPEVVLADQIDAGMKKHSDRLQEVEAQLIRERAERNLEKRQQQAIERGLDPADVEKAVTDKKIADWDTAMEYVEMSHRLAAPTPASYDEPPPFISTDKDFLKDPRKASLTEAHKVVDEIMAARRARAGAR